VQVGVACIAQQVLQLCLHRLFVHCVVVARHWGVERVAGKRAVGVPGMAVLLLLLVLLVLPILVILLLLLVHGLLLVGGVGALPGE
jgi:hypothetical protein